MYAKQGRDAAGEPDGQREEHPQQRPERQVEPERLDVTLDLLALDAVRVIERRPERAADIGMLARYVTEIRLLLQELSRLRRGCGDKLSPENIRRLGSRYLDLEGRVKELRNDLADMQ